VPFSLFVAVMTATALITALIGHQRSLLTEHVGRYTFDHIVRVGSQVPYQMLETPQFYDQLQRALASGTSRLLTMVASLTHIGTGLITAAGIAVVLFLLQPLLAVLVLLAAVPPLIAAITNSGASYAFQYSLTPEGRERAYLQYLMTNRESAKELRLLGIGEHLRDRYRWLTDDRLRRLHGFLRDRL
jgi:ABC-type multidrug transport system fused ATPase/permease subunit